MVSAIQKSNFTELDLRDKNNLLKIIWVNEEGDKNAGVSIGFFGKLSGSHITYHEDGSIHHKQGRKNIFPKFKRVPIANIDPFLQINFQTIPLNSQNISLTTTSDSKRIANKLIILELSDFYHRTQVSISSYMIKLGGEKKFLSTISRTFENFIIIGIEFIHLKWFSDHRVALVLLSEK